MKITQYTAFESSQEWSLANGSIINVSSQLSYYESNIFLYTGYFYQYFSTKYIRYYQAQLPSDPFLAVHIVPYKVLGQTVGLFWGISKSKAHFFDGTGQDKNRTFLSFNATAAAWTQTFIQDINNTDDVCANISFLVVIINRIKLITISTTLYFDTQ